jgi:hypothetical protein
MNLIARINAELEYVKKTTQEGDSVDCYARSVEYLIPIFAEWIKTLTITDKQIIESLQEASPEGFDWTPCDTELKQHRVVVKEQIDFILSELEKMK